MASRLWMVRLASRSEDRRSPHGTRYVAERDDAACVAGIAIAVAASEERSEEVTVLRAHLAQADAAKGEAKG